MISHIQMGSVGRFGNQMFQFSSLLGIGAKLGYDVKIPIENTDDDFTQFFNLQYNKSEPVGMELRKPFDIPDSYFTSRDEIVATLKQRYQEPNFHFNPETFSIPDNTDISGYFQSEKYFTHIESTIRDIYTFRSEIQQQATTELAKVKDDAPRVSIHVRRGDYINNSGNHTVLGLDYYMDAISKLFSDRPYRFVVFSDDPTWCAENFDGGQIVTVNNSYVEMCMMSMCDHHIIANSSFSWWGAWLNPSPTKLVAAPAQWFGPNIRHNNIIDLLPPTWFWI